MAFAVEGVDRNTTLRAYVTTCLTASLQRLAAAPTSAQLRFVDDNGPKGGPARRCAITLRLAHRPAVRVEASAPTARLAFDGALDRLVRRLTRHEERQRDRRRYPKKYFAARRAAAAE